MLVRALSLVGVSYVRRAARLPGYMFVIEEDYYIVYISIYLSSKHVLCIITVQKRIIDLDPCLYVYICFKPMASRAKINLVIVIFLVHNGTIHFSVCNLAELLQSQVNVSVHTLSGDRKSVV